MDQCNIWNLERKRLSGKIRKVYDFILRTKSGHYLITSQKVKGHYLPNKNTNNRGNSRNLKRKTLRSQKIDMKINCKFL